jgi:hypothetical protein
MHYADPVVAIAAAVVLLRLLRAVALLLLPSGSCSMKTKASLE